MKNPKKENIDIKNLEVDNSYLYHKFRSSIASQDFKKGDAWPTADLSSDDQLIAIAQLKPSLDEGNEQEIIEWKDKMVQNVMKMDDLTADVLDIISYLWIQNSKDPDSLIYVTADDFLRCRGIKEKKSGTGRRGGYEDTQRKDIAENIDILDKTWITVKEMELDEKTIQSSTKNKKKKVVWRGESKAVVITSRLGQMNLDGQIEPYAWRVRPGDCFAKFLFGPGRQTALLSQRALEYDPQKYKIEKRLARYFAWQWRNRSSNISFLQPFSIKTLLEACREDIDYSRPSRIRERLEKALDKLREDSVILGWQYENIEENRLNKRGWVNEWINLKILIEPPQIVMDQYQKINYSRKSSIKAKTEEKISNFDFTEIRKKRENLKLTLLQASEEMGISVSRLSRIERGEKPSPETLSKILSWLEV